MVNLQTIWLKNNKNQFFCNFFKLRAFLNLFCLSERKLRLQRLNVISKETIPFEKEFYSSLNLANLPQGDLQLNGGDCPGSNWHKGQWSGGSCLGGNWYRGQLSAGWFSGGQLAWSGTLIGNCVIFRHAVIADYYIYLARYIENEVSMLSEMPTCFFSSNTTYAPTRQLQKRQTLGFCTFIQAWSIRGYLFIYSIYLFILYLKLTNLQLKQI